MKTNSKYVAIKVKGIDHWFWFDRTGVSRDNGVFRGLDGWGDGGAMTEITVDEGLIEGEIASESLQYE